MNAPNTSHLVHLRLVISRFFSLRLVSSSLCLLLLASAFWAGLYVSPKQQIQEQVLTVEASPDGSEFVWLQNQRIPLSDIKTYALVKSENDIPDQTLFQRTSQDGSVQVVKLNVARHWGFWSLLAAADYYSAVLHVKRTPGCAAWWIAGGWLPH